MAATEVIIPVNVPDRMDSHSQPPKKRAPTVSKRKAAAEPEVVAPINVAGDDLPEETADEMNEVQEQLAKASQKEKLSKKAKVMSASIPNMAVGDVRKCLNQIRKAGSTIRENHLLWNGWPAGRFALLYLIGNYSNKKMRSNNDDDSAEGDDGAGDAQNNNNSDTGAGSDPYE